MTGKFLWALLIAHFCAPLPGFAATYSVFGIGSATTQRDNRPEATPGRRGLTYSYNYGVGLLDWFRWGRFSVETGVLYYQRSSEENLTAPGIIRNGTLACGIGLTPNACSATTISSATVLEIPFLFRLSLSKRLSVGIGGYYARYLGKLFQSEVMTPVGTKGTTTNILAPYSAFNRRTFDAGAAVAVGYDLGILKPSSNATVFVEGRYEKGLLNNDAGAGFVTKYDSILLFVGIRFIGKSGGGSGSGSKVSGKTHTW